ncbi:outer membrane beta-barrel protein [Flavivirga amylovorans]|uniref:Outer membrane beta-barrel protein n=1 Tax=Flavivirga amylovorans TaxID=870486 RepID=A0ABT8WZQ1_9FLAO|nr:outer membrane beta-barrel protein [Flavivirga amylovorans]MDO5986948.1 outer membrane beta-barrel protein [Flavivirga amylovorans]
MKKSLLTWTLIAVSAIAFSQITIKPGVRAGANFSNFTNTDLDSKTDLYIGALAEIKFVSFYALQPEINYSRQGGKAIVSGSDDLEIQYLGIALANKFYPSKAIGLHAIVGPAINIKVSDNFENNFNDDAEGFDFLFFGGLGFDFPFGLGIEARYNIGIVDIFGSNVNNTNGNNNVDDLILNKVFQIGAIYKFDF